jgi:hypothetical protein
MKIAVVVFFAVLFAGFPSSAKPQSKTPDKDFHGTYEELQPAQQKLVDQWYAEYSRLTGDHLSPTNYDELPVSTRTTFEAVTHALLTTNLTDASEKPLGNALALVQKIESVNGKVPKVRGDLQFRIYVALVPTALDTLKQSKQFYRDHDNTVYHKGYPISYRQGGGDPSIQFSMSKDARHADIDVDYRSSRFPMALFNGHLTAANSDVRAGNNTNLHGQRWSGLADWWQLLFGLAGAQETVAVTQDGDIPAQPRKGTGNLETAVNDFLSSWLVEQKPELAAAYLSPRSFACLAEYGPQAGTDLNVGLAPYVAARDMTATVHLLGKVDSLQQVAKSYPIQDSSYKQVSQQKGAPFSLSQVTNRAATELDCDPKRAYDDFDRFRSNGSLDKFADFYTSTFRLQSPGERTDGITLLWKREDKNWKIAAWDIEPEEGKPGKLPDTRVALASAPPASTAKAVAATADPGFQQAVSRFFQTWLVEENSETAASYFSPQCYECINLYLAEGEAPPATAEAQFAYLRTALAAISKEIGTIRDPRDAMESVTPEHDGLRFVKHADEGAYALVAVPDSLADTFLCSKRSAENPYRPAESGAPVYGTYYAALFALRTPGEHPPTVSLLWKKDAAQWKIVAYDLSD